MKKNNIRSIRFSDELMEIINQQVGENFNQKFERLVYNCYMLSAVKEKEIQRLDEQIRARRVELSKLQTTCFSYRNRLPRIGQLLDSIEHTIADLL